MTTLFVEQLTVIDASYLCPRRGLVGESWIVDLELEGALDEQSMVLDFGSVKKQLKRAIDEGPDHTLIVPLHYPAQQTATLEDGRVRTLFMSAVGGIEHTAPAGALTLLEAPEVTTDALIAHLAPPRGHCWRRSRARAITTRMGSGSIAATASASRMGIARGW